jgi:CRISPR system Cascade subunit CasE
MNTEPLYLSRARLKTGRGEALSAIAPALLNGSKGGTVGHAHRILWMLFQGREDEPRDFLWREEKPGQYLILSRRPPSDPHALFELKYKEFAPELSVGDVLSFALRANPVVHRKVEGARLGKTDRKGRTRSARCDIVMDALSSLPGKMPGECHGETPRAKHRHDLTRSAARAWIETQGEKYGFRLVMNAEKDEPYLGATN